MVLVTSNLVKNYAEMVELCRNRGLLQIIPAFYTFSAPRLILIENLIRLI